MSEGQVVLVDILQIINWSVMHMLVLPGIPTSESHGSLTGFANFSWMYFKLRHSSFGQNNGCLMVASIKPGTEMQSTES